MTKRRRAAMTQSTLADGTRAALAAATAAANVNNMELAGRQRPSRRNIKRRPR